LSEGDKLEIVQFIGGGNDMSGATPVLDKPFVVAGRELKSRLIIGTGKYKSYAENAAALEASGAEMVHGGAQARERDGARRAAPGRFHRPEEIRLPTEHGRLLHG
jgi:hypothetical protein